MPVVHISAS